MPTTRRRRRQGRREGLTAAWEYRLFSGTWPSEADLPGEDSRELAAVFFATDEKAAQMWAMYAEALVELWVSERPGSRPAGFWQFSASEPRRVLDEGAAWVSRNRYDGEPWAWRAVGGVPALTRPALVESEARYLDRHGLLQPGERRRIRPGAWKPVPIAPLRFVAEMFGP